jgi:hypothetical protein
MSYPGTGDLEIVGVSQSCVNSPKSAPNQCAESSNSFIQLRFLELHPASYCQADRLSKSFCVIIATAERNVCLP